MQNVSVAAGIFGSDAMDIAVRDLGPVRFLPVIRGRDGGFSAIFDGRSVWMFGDTPLNTAGVDGSEWRSSTWAWTDPVDARRGVSLREPLDANGAPGEFLPFTPEERAYNAAHDQDTVAGHEQSRWRLWPGPIVVDPRTHRAFVFYFKVMARNGPFDGVGQSIALWDSLDRAVVRPRVTPGADEPTLLSVRGDIPEVMGALAVHDSLYAVRCIQGGPGFPCIVSRVAFDDALVRSAWEFYAGGGRWTADWHQAIRVLDAGPMVSVHWNEHLRRYLAVYSPPLSSTIEMRTAEHVEGPWSPGQVIATGRPPASKDSWDYCGVAHAELQQAGGEREYVTYCRDTGNFTSELRLLEITFR